MTDGQAGPARSPRSPKSPAINTIQASLAKATRLRDQRPQEALGIVESVRANLRFRSGEHDPKEVSLWLAECALNAAWVHVRLGHFEATYPEADEGLRLFQEQGIIQGAASCLLVKGIALGEEGKNDESVRLCLEADALFKEIGDPIGRARAINASGIAYRSMGDSARAIGAYTQSLNIAQESGDSQGESRALANLGYIYLLEKKYEKAIEHSRRTLAMEREHGNLSAELANCCNMVEALIGVGRHDEAVSFIGGYDLDALADSGLFAYLQLSESVAKAYHMAGRHKDANALITTTIARARRDGNLRELATHLCTFAKIKRSTPAEDPAQRAKNMKSARAALVEALELAGNRDRDFVHAIHEEFCALCRDEGRWDEAFTHMEEAHRIALTLNAASAEERLARQKSEQEVAVHKAQAEADARQLQIERKVLQSQKIESLGVLAGGVAHHFNNLLTSILGHAELAQLNPDLVPEALTAIMTSGQRAAELCRQIMMYTGRSEPRFTSVDLPTLVHESIGLLGVSLEKNCELACEFPEGEHLVWGDPAQLQQIILNLATNSAEARATRVLFKARVVHGPSGSRNPFEALSQGDYLELSVADNGEGMTPDVRARIFEPFYSTKFTGRGLGLPAVMGLLRAHQGTISVESTPGTGTTIRVYIPMAPHPVAAPAEPKVVALPTSSGTALIADDESMVRRVLVQYLNRRGWKTIVAEDGAEAVKMHGEHSGPIDLLILDHLMPNLSGLEAAARIRVRDPKVPVILMSGFTNQETQEKIRSQGFAHFLKKPFQLQELLQVIQQAAN